MNKSVDECFGSLVCIPLRHRRDYAMAAQGTRLFCCVSDDVQVYEYIRILAVLGFAKTFFKTLSTVLVWLGQFYLIYN